MVLDSTLCMCVPSSSDVHPRIAMLAVGCRQKMGKGAEALRSMPVRGLHPRAWRQGGRAM